MAIADLSLSTRHLVRAKLTEREERLVQEYANGVMEGIAKRAPQTARGNVPAGGMDATRQVGHKSVVAPCAKAAGLLGLTRVKARDSTRKLLDLA